MDKETIALIEDVRKSLIKFRDQTTSDSVKKKTRKVTSQIIWDASSYLDELDNIKATSKTEAEAIDRIRSLVRSSEEAALDAMQFLPDDTVHHEVQTRTGGDDLTDMDYRRSGPIIEELSDKHKMRFSNTTGPGGNLRAELSLSNAAHKFDDRATGLERESGIGKAIPKAETAHPKGTAGHTKLKGVDWSDDASVREGLDRSITQQRADASRAIQSDAPRQKAIQNLVPGAYSGTADDVAAARKVIQPQLLTNKSAILDAYRMLTKVPGGKALMSAIPVVGLGFGAVEAKERTETAAKTKNPVDAFQATLSTAGLAPAVGIIPDAANAIIDVFRYAMQARPVKDRSKASFQSGAMK
jgi:hypothetical protein